MCKYLAGVRSAPNCFVNASSVGPEIGELGVGLSPGRGRTSSTMIESIFNQCVMLMKRHKASFLDPATYAGKIVVFIC